MLRALVLRRCLWSVGLLILALACDASRADARRTLGPATGLRAVSFAQPAPDFAFAPASGRRHLRDLAGRPVVVNFWATWCEPCEAELDAFAHLRDNYGERVALVTISDEAPGVARAALAAHHLEATVVEDPARTIFESYSIVAIPVTLVLGPRNAVTHVSVGQIDWPELRDAVAPLLPPAPAHLTPEATSSKLKGNVSTPDS